MNVVRTSTRPGALTITVVGNGAAVATAYDIHGAVFATATGKNPDEAYARLVTDDKMHSNS